LGTLTLFYPEDRQELNNGYSKISQLLFNNIEKLDHRSRDDDANDLSHRNRFPVIFDINWSPTCSLELYRRLLSWILYLQKN